LRLRDETLLGLVLLPRGEVSTRDRQRTRVDDVVGEVEPEGFRDSGPDAVLVLGRDETGELQESGAGLVVEWSECLRDRFPLSAVPGDLVA
jgi:hypothetical protein